MFENAVNVSDIGNPAKISDVNDLLNRVSDITRRHHRFLSKLPQFIGMKTDFTFITSLFMNVRDYIICIDDLERRSASLPLSDVLGLVSFLSQERNCKVVVLLNDGELSDSDAASLKRFSEKVFDSLIRFAPGPSYGLEASNLLPGSTLRFSCEQLGIVNIRVLNKISALFKMLEPIIDVYSDDLKRQAAQSVALLGWSVHEPEIAPRLSYILNERVSFMFGVRKSDLEVPPEVAVWNALLDKVGFSNADDFDRALADGIQNGFFDTAQISKFASENDEKLSHSKSTSAIHQVWEEYHSSFDTTHTDFLERAYKVYIDNISQVGIMDLQGLVSLLRDFSEGERATKLIKIYVGKCSSNPTSLDISAYPWRHEIKDPEIKDALAAARANLKMPVDVKQSMLTMFSKGGGIGAQQMEVLSGAPVEDYFKIFKESSGEVLKNAISSCLEFDRISNASPDMRTISSKAKQALKIIGCEDEFKARKVKAYGVDITQTYYQEIVEAPNQKPTP